MRSAPAPREGAATRCDRGYVSYLHHLVGGWSRGDCLDGLLEQSCGDYLLDDFLGQNY